jgi:class 3 adenylate cyclase
MILWGGFLCEYIVVNLYPIVFRMSPKSALVISAVDFAILAISLAMVGTKMLLFAVAITVHLAVSLSNVVVCTVHEKTSRAQFCVAKATKILASKRRNLLHTLIPDNVMLQLASHPDQGMPAASIPHCTVMFCLLEPQTVSQSATSEHQFNLLNDVFSEFDDIVQRFGMFKYHHVGDSYVVACPRAACPFDAAEQAAPYPARHSRDMAMLADELQRAAERHQLWDGHVLNLRVGIACGPAAGCVLGAHRSFYCLVGNTVNTASRMCKYARGPIHTTAEFAALLAADEVP